MLVHDHIHGNGNYLSLANRDIHFRVLRGTVSCAAVSNKTAAFYCFMFPEAKKQQDLIKFKPAFSWGVLE